MRRFQSIDQQTLPTESVDMVKTVESKYGFVPNLIKGLAHAPEALSSYLTLERHFESSTLTPEERHVVLLTASRFNECEYCTSVHSMTAEQTDLEWKTIERIRNREPLTNARLESLRRFTEAVTKRKGDVPHDLWSDFEDAGFDARAALDVTLGVTLKTLTNSVNYLIETPLDEEFRKRAWTRSEVAAAHAAARDIAPTRSTRAPDTSLETARSNA